MKRNLGKKVLALALAVVMIFTLSSSAFATVDEETPVIVVSGMNSFNLINADTDEVAFPPTTDAIIKTVTNVALPLTMSLASNNWSIFADKTVVEVNKLFKQIECDENGVPKSNIEVMKFPQALSEHMDEITFTEEEGKIHFYGRTEKGVARSIGDEIGFENTYFFNYDWRLDPIDHADDLKVMVDNAKADTGSDKVSIVGISMGGTIVSAYLDKYGSDDIKSITFGSTAFMGVDLVGRLFSGNVKIEMEELIDFIVPIIGGNEAVAELFGLATDGLSYFYIDRCVDKYIKNIVKGLKDPAFEEIFSNNYLAMFGIWSLMPGKYYEDAKAYTKSLGVLSDEFYEKTDAYHEIQERTEQNIADARADGTDVYIIGSYGYHGIPLVKKSDTRTDNLIDTKYMTGNCTVAKYGEELCESDYVYEKTCTNPLHKHISTDNVIDASTGILPEHTWVIDGMSHVDYNMNQDTGRLITWLATTEESVDVYSNPEFPQFVKLNAKTGEFSSLTQGVDLGNVSQLDRFISLLADILKTMRDLFNKFF